MRAYAATSTCALNDLWLEQASKRHASPISRKPQRDACGGNTQEAAERSSLSIRRQVGRVCEVLATRVLTNVNGDVDALLGLGRLRRVLAQVEVTFSNSMIVAWWRSLKHNWLFLNRLDTLAAVERLVAFYVQQ
jgi:hypothetical protein